jgi:hypothetical protein
MSTTTKKATKQTVVIARYAHKTDGVLNGIVTYLVRSSDGESTYCTTLVQGKASGCSCKSRNGRCYHRTQLTVLEASRQVAVVETPAQQVVEVAEVVPVEEVAPVAIEPIYVMSEAVREKLAAIAKPAVVVETPKQTYRIVSLGSKKERRDLVGEITAKAEHKQDMLAEIREIQERAIAQQVAQTPDMMKAALTSNRGFRILR